jgi:hypothetical protein
MIENLQREVCQTRFTCTTNHALIFSSRFIPTDILDLSKRKGGIIAKSYWAQATFAFVSTQADYTRE